MAILNIESLNWDHAFKVSHLPAKGETVAAKSANLSLGGKGQNGAVKLMKTRIRLLPQPKSMRSIIDATQREQLHG